jgi:hypothetical protein
MALQDALETILAETANRLQIVSNVGRLTTAGTLVEPGELVTLKLQPEIGPVLVTDLLGFPINLPLTIETAGEITGNLPVPLATSTTLTNLLKAPLNLPVTLGTVSALNGILPVPLAVPVTPRASVKWKITRGGRALKRGVDYIAPDGLGGIDLPLLLLPVFEELRLSAPEKTVAPGMFLFEVTAEVTLSVLYRDIPLLVPEPGTPALPVREAKAKAQIEIKLQLPALLLPTVLVMTKDSNLRGAALVVVPEDSPVKALEKVMETLRPIQAVLRKVTAVAELAAFLTGLSDLLFILDNQPHLVFIARDEIKNLNDIDLIQNAWYTLNDIEAEDELSAMIMIGPNNRIVTCYLRQDLKDDQGAFSLNLKDSNWAAIRYLHTKTPVSEPSSSRVKPPVVPIFVNPPGQVQLFPTDFGDNISSLKLDVTT